MPESNDVRSFENLFSCSETPLRKQQLMKSVKNHLPSRSVRIAVISDSTVKEMTDFLTLFLRLKRIDCVLWIGDFNKIYEDAVFRTEEVASFQPDIILIHETGRAMNSERFRSEFRQRYEAIWSKLELLNCQIIQTTIPLPALRPMQNGDLTSHSGTVRQILQINLWIAEQAAQKPMMQLLDLSYLSANVGLQQWYDDRLWYLYGCAYSQRVVPTVSYALAKLVLSLLGLRHKLLILDLDNTLWGGVWADDGPSGVLLGGETASGHAYQAFQQYLLQLKQNGMILAICSKNHMDSIRDCFDHPASVLKWQDFAAVKVNWQPKSENIKQIIQELNLSPDSAVFLDDNPVERMQVSREIPELWIPELDKVENYTFLLQQGLIFDQQTVTAEDRQRTQYYKSNKHRDDIKMKYPDRDSYLKNLGMKLYLVPPMACLDRIVQLINKTNQFQVTGKRSSEAAMHTYLQKHRVLAARLVDIFGDNGIISVMGISIQADTATIDYWVMSCRVFQRDVEFALLHYLAERLKQTAVKKIRISYVQTPKNSMIGELLPKLGFGPVTQTDEGMLYEMEIAQYSQNRKHFIEVYDDERVDS